LSAADLSLPDETLHPHPLVTTVSIIIPTFNRGPLLVNAVESALQQTHPYCEIIVVDDGSTDDTVERLAPFLGRIRYVYQENHGVSGALNTGVEIARGHWIAVLASDDQWLPNKLALQFKAIAELGKEFGACFTDCSYMGDPARLLSAFEEAQLECRSEFGPVGDPQKYVLAKHPAFYVQSLLVLRSLLEQVNRFDQQLVVGEDTDLLFRLAFHTRFCFVRSALVKIDRTPYRPRLTDLNTSANDPMLTCREYRYNKWLALPELTDQKIRRTIQESRHEVYYIWAIRQIYEFDFSGALGKIRQLQKTGVPLPRIIVTLLFRAARRFFSPLAGGRKKDDF
jgi:glycosyltransferase involved in cell wall biosynthesis